MTCLKLKDFAVQDLKPLNLMVNNEIVCLSGASGSGKSLLLRSIIDLIVHTGEAYIDDIKCSETLPVQWRTWVGYLPAESAWWMDAVGDHFKDKECEHLQLLNLPASCIDWEVTRCSTGEKQRLAIARLLQQQPKVLLLDEPTASQDPASVASVEALIKKYSAEHQVPVIWVSHDPEQIKRVATRHYRIENNEVIEVNA